MKTTAILARSDAHPTVWTVAEPGVHVGSRRGRVLGSVMATATGSFIAFDDRMAPLGRHDSLRSAKRSALARDREPSQDRPSPWRARALVAASVAGAVAGVLVLAAGLLSPFV